MAHLAHPAKPALYEHTIYLKLSNDNDVLTLMIYWVNTKLLRFRSINLGWAWASPTYTYVVYMNSFCLSVYWSVHLLHDNLQM